MATYHFVPQEAKSPLGKDLPGTRVTAEYGKYSGNRFGTLIKAHLFLDNTRTMILGNCEGSLIIIDTTREVSQNPINKLHIGELYIRRPHAESYEEKGEEGVRVDLAEFDTHYAVDLLKELVAWRDPAYRKERLVGYERGKKWYCVPFRVKQLHISPEGLEKKIEELSNHIKWLREPERRETRRLVYNHAREIESTCYNVVTAMAHATKVHLPGAKKLPKLIVNPDIVDAMRRIESGAKNIFDYICPKINVERARNYWNEIAAWENL